MKLSHAGFYISGCFLLSVLYTMKRSVCRVEGGLMAVPFKGMLKLQSLLADRLCKLSVLYQLLCFCFLSRILLKSSHLNFLNLSDFTHRICWLPQINIQVRFQKPFSSVSEWAAPDPPSNIDPITSSQTHVELICTIITVLFSQGVQI